MFYFISGVCDIKEPIKVPENFTIRNPNKEEYKILVEKSEIIKKQRNVLVDTETNDSINNLLKQIIIFDFDDRSTYLNADMPKNFNEFMKGFTKHKNIINFFMFIISRLDNKHNDFTLTSSLMGNGAIDNNGFVLFQKFITNKIIYPFEKLNLDTINKSILRDIFSVYDLLKKKKIERITYIGEIISLINETSDYKLKFNLLIGILEHLLVNLNGNISEQIKIKMIAVLIKVEQYDSKYSVPMENDYFKDYKNYYNIRNYIAHGNFKEIKNEINTLFGKDSNITSITYGLETNVSKLLYVYLINSHLINLLKES